MIVDSPPLSGLPQLLDSASDNASDNARLATVNERGRSACGSNVFPVRVAQ